MIDKVTLPKEELRIAKSALLEIEKSLVILENCGTFNSGILPVINNRQDAEGEFFNYMLDLMQSWGAFYCYICDELEKEE